MFYYYTQLFINHLSLTRGRISGGSLVMSVLFCFFLNQACQPIEMIPNSRTLKIIYIFPTDETEKIDRDTDILTIFSDEVECGNGPSQINSSTYFIYRADTPTPVGANITCNNNQNTSYHTTTQVVLNPNNNLDASKEYHLRISKNIKGVNTCTVPILK